MNQAALPAAGRILVVDDSEGTRYVVASWLRRARYDVVEAKTGAEALALVSTSPIDLVVLDVNLPDMSGYAVCEHIKSESRTAAIPVLHVSATATDVADVSEGLRRGAEGYLTEPVEREELVATVEALLRAAAAQRTAVRLARQLRQLNEATHALNEAASLEQLVATIAREAGSLFESPATAAVVVGDRALGARSSPTAAGLFLTAQSIDALRGAIGNRRRVCARAIAGLLPASSCSEYLCAPLDDVNAGRGLMLVEVRGDAERRPLDDEIEVVLRLYVRAARTALKNMRAHDIERNIALTLQHSLLPELLPDVPGLEIAVRYAASTEHAEVGGDFYDVFSLADGRVIFTIGDVAGHSLEAATVMAQLRTAIRAYLLEGHTPAEALAHLNGLVRHFHPDMTATACCVSYDGTTGRCELAIAGHLPPLLVGQRGHEFLPIGGSLLGLAQSSVGKHTFELRPGDVLLLYTDGLVERRDETLDDGFDRLARAALAIPDRLAELCDRLILEVGPAAIVDDIALMAIRRVH